MRPKWSSRGADEAGEWRRQVRRRQDSSANRLAACQPIGSPTASPMEEQTESEGREEQNDQVDSKSVGHLRDSIAQEVTAADPRPSPCNTAHGAPANEMTHAR